MVPKHLKHEAGNSLHLAFLLPLLLDKKFWLMEFLLQKEKKKGWKQEEIARLC